MKNSKAALVIIILLLIVSVPCSLIGIAYKVGFLGKKEPAPVVEKPKTFFEGGKLNFYSNDNLIGQYTCKNPNGYCGWAYETIDDSEYYLKYYNDTIFDMIQLVSQRYAFIVDVPEIKDDNYAGEDIILYDVVDNNELKVYKAVKNYTIGINNNYYIVKDEEDKWGVIQLTNDSFTEIIPNQYDYIGLKDDINESTNKLVSKMFVAQKSGEWYLLDLNDTQLSKPISHAIVDYNDDSMIVYYYSRYALFDYNATMLLDSQAYKYVAYIKNYVGYIDGEGNFGVYDYKTNQMITKDKYPLSSSVDLELTTNGDGSVDIFISGEFKESIN